MPPTSSQSRSRGGGTGSVAGASEVSSLGGSPFNAPPTIGIKKMKSTKMHKFMAPVMTTSDMARSIQFIAEWVVDTGQPFNVVERPTFKRMIDSFRARASEKLPGRKKMRSVIMEMAGKAQKEVCDLIEGGKVSGRRVGITIDGWNGSNKKHVEGVMVKVGRLVYPGDCEECGSNHDGVRVARSWVELCDNQDLSWNYLTTDSAGQCGRARRILARRYPDRLFNCCWAHQLNLMVKHLLEHEDFAVVAQNAAKVAKAFSKSSSKWLPKLNDQVKKTYGFVHTSGTQVLRIGETRWNSSQGCFASLLRIRKALRLFAVAYAGHDKWPAIFNVLEEPSFWHPLAEAELMIRPFCEASFLMQRRVNNMGHVLLVLLNLTRHVQEYCGKDSATAKDMLKDIERRWATTENHLFFLCFAFHPAFRHVAQQMVKNSLMLRGSWTNSRNPLTTVRLSHAAKSYYEKFDLFYSSSEEGREKELANVAKHVTRYLKTPTFMSLPYTEGEDPYDRWDYFKDEETEVAVLAQFLLDAPVQSADVERLFKTFSEYLTDKRNRLKTDALFGSACVKDALKRKYPEDMVGKDGEEKRHSKNRFVNPTEYQQYDFPAPGQTEQGASDGNNERIANEQPIMQDATSDVEEDETSTTDESQDQDVDTRLPGEDDFSHVMRALSYLESQEPEEDWADALEDDNSDDEEEVEDNGDGSLPFEHPPERRDINMEPIPDVDDKRYPQENSAYFRSKKYCRKDKYTLVNLLAGDVDLPTVTSAFST